LQIHYHEIVTNYHNLLLDDEYGVRSQQLRA